MKNVKTFEELTEISTVNCLLNCGFEEITEEDIPNYTGDDEDDLSSYENENVYDFGYLTYDNYCIIKLNRNRDDAVLRYNDGSSEFIIRFNNKLYMGYWSEGENIIGRDDNWGENSNVFPEFKEDMIKNGISLYYCVNF